MFRASPSDPQLLSLCIIFMPVEIHSAHVDLILVFLVCKYEPNLVCDSLRNDKLNLMPPLVVELSLFLENLLPFALLLI